MKCCFASSLEKTITLSVLPISPDSNRRTSTFPRDPVPPVTTTRLPSKNFIALDSIQNRALCQPSIVKLENPMREGRIQWLRASGCHRAFYQGRNPRQG